MELWQVIVAFGGGLLAGVINTLAGNGSAVTLIILTEVLGLPGNIANGSNRIGVALQTLTSAFTFRHYGVTKFREQRRPIFITMAGAIFGIFVAVNISNEAFREVFKYLMVLMLIFLLIKPSKWVRDEQIEAQLPQWLLWSALFILGFYGGFIQMGMGIFFIALAVLGAGYTLLQANAIKVIIISLYSIVALAVFWWEGYVDLIAGGIIALGQILGGYIGAKYSAKLPWMGTATYYLLIIVIVASVFSLFFR